MFNIILLFMCVCVFVGIRGDLGRIKKDIVEIKKFILRTISLNIQNLNNYILLYQ